MENHGFFKRLFDLSFKEFITPKIVTFLFIVEIIIGGLGGLGLLIKGISSGVGMAFLSLIIAPIFFLLYVVFSRIWLEIVIVLFRIAENTTLFVEQKQEKKSET